VRKDRRMQQSQDFIKSWRVGRVATITIDHPPTNSIGTGILQQLAELVSGYEADDSIRAILLDSANGKPPFAADATDLLANPSWEKQFQLIQAGGAHSHSNRILLQAGRDGHLRWHLHGRRLETRAGLPYSGGRERHGFLGSRSSCGRGSRMG